MRSTFPRRFIGVCAVALSLACVAGAAPATQPSTQPAKQPATQSKAHPGGGMKGIHIDLKDHWIDLDAKVAQRNGDWLELLACSPGTQDYESLLTVAARPRNIHLALLMLGLKPGHPLQMKKMGTQYITIPPAGPKLQIFIRYKKNGKMVQVPANDWLVNQKTHQPMKSNTFLFVGSEFGKSNGKQLYAADISGWVISLVNSGDEVISRPTELTNGDNGGVWNANARLVPKDGTPVTIRIEPAPRSHAKK